MDDELDYLQKLRNDMIQQFKGKPNIEILMTALSRQLSELYEFFLALNTLRHLQTAEGIQLDGIGDIVVMSRQEALVISNLAGLNVPMDDKTYRLYLAWKIHVNTSSCTHRDVYKALKMFWDKPLYYSENPEHPATIIFNTPTLSPEDNVSVLFLAPKVKAAGVALHINATTQAPEMPVSIYAVSVQPISIMTTELPMPNPGSFEAYAYTNQGIAGNITASVLPYLPDVPRYAYLRDGITGAVIKGYISDSDGINEAMFEK